MAKGGKRTYARDGNGRFASTPGSAAKKAAKSTSGRASTLGARTGLKGSKAKLRAKDKADQTLQNTLSTRAQKGAVKRGSRKLAAVKTAAQARIGGGRKGVIGKPKGMKNRQLAGRVDGPVKTASGSTKRALKRTGKTLKIAVKKAPKPSKEDRSIDKVRNLKIATEMGRLGGFGSMKFIPDKQMTPSRRKALGLSWVQNRSESQRFRISNQTVGSVSGVLISEKSSYLAKLPKKRQGVIRGKKKPATVARAARKPSTASAAKQAASKPPIRIKSNKSDTLERKLMKSYNRLKGVEARVRRQVNSRQGNTPKTAKTIDTIRKANAFMLKHGFASAFNKRPVFSTNPRKATPPTRTKGSRTTLPRTPGTVAKPKGLKPGEITNRIMNRDRAAIKAASTRIDRANKRGRRLASIQREIDYKRANPVGGKAFRGQATKRLNKEQRKLDKSRATVFSAIELNYKPKQQKAEARLAQMTRAVRATSDLRVSRKKTTYQRNVFGGSTVSYGR